MLSRPVLLTLGDTTIQPDAVISNRRELPDLIGRKADALDERALCL